MLVLQCATSLAPARDALCKQQGEPSMRTMIRAIGAIALAAAACASQAAPVSYVADNAHTFPRFSYNHFGFSTQLSRFDKTTGTVVYDREAKTGSVDMTIDMKSVNTGFPLFNEHIQGPDFFDTAKYPTANFKSTKVNFDGDKPVSVDGDLTIKGVTKPVTLTLTSFQTMRHPVANKDALGANAYTVVKRSDFNAGKYAPGVSDDVRIDLAIEAFRE
jgi:polyisoprenoid-binding protein YceI